MQVFKFGGASVKDAEGVKNVAKVLQFFREEEIMIVVSAMGKTTNALEQVADAFYTQSGNASTLLNQVKEFHLSIVNALFASNHPIHIELNNTFVELEWAIEEEISSTYSFHYDQIVSLGEIISTKIVSAYLNDNGFENEWKDARDIIKTDNNYREGKVNWELTQDAANSIIRTKKRIVTQGFIGATSENYTTTLGREGSDYTAAILAHLFNANSVTIWKDVPGLLNADPKLFSDAQMIAHISFHDAIELAYYGATVIHPKTIKPLQNQNIPLHVKSFLQPQKAGTVINNEHSIAPIPCFIVKQNQILVSISSKDFSFIVEENLSQIFNLFYEHQVKINLMQNSAISFSVSIDKDERKTKALFADLQKNYKLLYNEGLELITIRHYTPQAIERTLNKKQLLLEIKSRQTIQLLIKS
jgi:aspartate kinase